MYLYFILKRDMTDVLFIHQSIYFLFFIDREIPFIVSRSLFNSIYCLMVWQSAYPKTDSLPQWITYYDSFMHQSPARGHRRRPVSNMSNSRYNFILGSDWLRALRTISERELPLNITFAFHCGTTQVLVS